MLRVEPTLNGSTLFLSVQRFVDRLDLLRNAVGLADLNWKRELDDRQTVPN